jgi:hypothetical protein
MTNNSRIVNGLFRDSASVERAYEVVSQRSYGMADINAVMSDDTRRRYFSDDRQINVDWPQSCGGWRTGRGQRWHNWRDRPPLIAAGVVAPGLGAFLAGPVHPGNGGAGAAA